MQYIKSKDLDYINSFFHFSRIDSRDSIEQIGLQAVAGGENGTANDRNNKTIYFSKGINGVLKAIDVWARWEYDRYISKSNRNINYGYQGYDKSVMKEIIYDKLYNDFKNRQYYLVDLEEGKAGDFEYGDIDVKKIFARDKDGLTLRRAVWEYGEFSDWGTLDNPNNVQESWNMNTKIGERTISSDRLKIIETERGRTDALSFVLEAYSKFRTLVLEQNSSMYEILDNFMSYAKERYKNDKDYAEGMPDLGRRAVDRSKEKAYKTINKISTKSLGEQVVEELEDTQFLEETERTLNGQLTAMRDDLHDQFVTVK